MSVPTSSGHVREVCPAFAATNYVPKFARNTVSLHGDVIEGIARVFFV